MKRKEKIIISNFDDLKNPYYGGGGAIAIHQVGKRLASNYDITVYTGKYPGAKNSIIDNVKYKRIGLTFLGPKLGQLAFQLLLPYYVKKDKYSLWIESFTPPFSTGFLQLFTERPVVGLTHMLCSEDMERKYKLPFGMVERRGLKHYDHVITLTDELKGKIEKITDRTKVSVVPNAVNEDIRLRKESKKKYILYISRIELNQKGIDLLIESYCKIKNETNIKLVIAGSGEPKEIKKMEKIIEKYKLTNDVILTGRVDLDEKIKLMSEAVCMVVPSRYESFSITALEALYAGVPLLSFDIEGLAWIPDSASVKVEKFNTSKMAKEILSVIRSKSKQLQLIENGKKVAVNYRWSKIVKLYDAVIRDVVTQGAAN